VRSGSSTDENGAASSPTDSPLYRPIYVSMHRGTRYKLLRFVGHRQLKLTHSDGVYSGAERTFD